MCVHARMGMRVCVRWCKLAIVCAAACCCMLLARQCMCHIRHAWSTEYACIHCSHVTMLLFKNHHVDCQGIP